MSTLQINKTKYKQFKIAAIGSSSVLALGGLAFLQPFSLTDNSYAENSSLDMSVTLNPTISIWTTDTNNNTSAQVNISTSPDETVSTETIRVHVSTNNLTGYTLTIQSNSNDAKMKHENSSITRTINPIISSGASSFTWAVDGSLNNMWGYSIGNNDSFKAIPSKTASAATINSSDTPSLDSYTDTTFGTKVDLNTPAGTYTNTVIFSAVANNTPDLWLQDMTASDCAALSVYDSSNSATTTYTRYDKRDGQPYKIRRLKMDTGSNTACWMVENLKLTKTTIEAAGNSATLDNSTSDVASDSAFTLTASDTSTWCQTSSADCDDQSMVISTDYGTLYNWYAATAGTGTYSKTSGAATASICPGKGAGTGPATKTWHLPTGKTNGEWYNLFAAYQSEYGWSTIGGTSNTGTMTKTWNQDIGPAFIYSGYRNGVNTGGQSSTGFGNWWSSTAYDNNRAAYDAYLNYTNRYVNGGTVGSNKYYGYAVRCVLSSE